MIAHIPGREQEAWDKLLALWNAPNDVHREPVIATELALLLPKIKIINPTADLPPEIAAQADKLLEKRARSERLLRRRVPIIDTMRLPHPSGR